MFTTRQHFYCYSDQWLQKKRKLIEENRVFNDALTDLYFFINCNGKTLCLICQKTLAIQKEYNVKCHYDTEHKAKFACLVGESRINKINALKSLVKNQQDGFKVQVQSNESSVRASLRVAEILAKSGRPFTDSEVIKQCALVMAEEVCPDQKKKFENISLSMETDYRDVVYHSEVRWLSRGTVLKKIFDFRKEIETFKDEKGKSIPELTDTQWLIDLGFLTDITYELNMLNVRLQGKKKLISDMHTDVKAFQMKIKLFIIYW